ncbi:MAG: hypothetical protein IJF13_00360 [Clostridia bacterium]|nr:hypothetical protein [Clostridia bacterium]
MEIVMIIDEHFSLLYPDEETKRRHEKGELRPNISAEVIESIGLGEYLELKSAEISEFFTTDPDTIRFRQKVFRDIKEVPEIGRALTSVFPILSDIIDLRRLDSAGGESTENYLTSITEIELYISCIEKLNDGFAGIRDRVMSETVAKMIDTISTLTESDYYKELNEKLSALSGRVREIKSITVGVNLDGQLRPTDAGVLSINPLEFKSGDIIEKILSFNFKKDEYTCIAPLVPFDRSQNENRRMALSHAFNSAINDVFKSSVKGWRKIVNEYVLENTDFLIQLMPEIELLVKGARFVSMLEGEGGNVTMPEILPGEEKAFSACGLYNPDVALRAETDIVKNDIKFDDDGRIFVLTGPNRGGKSVITCAIGSAQIMAQLGLPVPADSISLSPVSSLYTHFPAESGDTIDKGRLGEECARLGEILDKVDGDSMILLDESLSSTGAYEASYIAAELLQSFSVIGCRGIFSTHLHELAARVDEINAKCREFGGVGIDSIVADITDGKRSFKIVRRRPDGKSYAKDITDKYGLSFDRVIDRIKNEK